jgi:hypothetical protein
LFYEAAVMSKVAVNGVMERNAKKSDEPDESNNPEL